MADRSLTDSPQLSKSLRSMAPSRSLVTGFWIKSRQEERLLTTQFVDEYPRYRRRVKALIPFVL